MSATSTRPAPSDRQPSIKQRRSGNPATRAGVGPAATTASTSDTPGRARLSAGRFVAGLIAIVVATSIYTFAVMFLPTSTTSALLVATLAVPALVTMAFIPEARTQALYRWPVAWTIGFTSAWPLPALVLAQTWVIARYWLVEYAPRSPVRLPSRSKADRAPRTTA